MPIDCGVDILPVEQERFHAVDKVVMRHAFDMHNSMGRFLDERIYQDELARRCRDSGFDVHREVEIRVSHRDFMKPYYLDLLVESGMIDELKAADSLNTAHQKQLIHYLLLAGLKHGKLVNFRPQSVQSRYVSTSLNPKDRMDFRLETESWQGADDQSRWLKDTLEALLGDWGAFLDANLYREALLHFLRHPDTGIQPVGIEVNGQVIGSQKMSILAPDTAWHLSATRIHLQSYENHIARLLSHTRLKRIHWINFNHRSILLKTLSK